MEGTLRVLLGGFVTSLLPTPQSLTVLRTATIGGSAASSPLRRLRRSAKDSWSSESSDLAPTITKQKSLCAILGGFATSRPLQTSPLSADPNFVCQTLARMIGPPGSARRMSLPPPLPPPHPDSTLISSIVLRTPKQNGLAIGNL
ncbi:hypothetical protein L596_002394 [Steinernema carpocapsae]|uniref:Uncharacterized protein n=1 Tax=Steinernema carpocapsae TaxID=34508 RepID=A0A4U8UQZ5_STECR|nr:hypothetical protein L596_002394 [Steinernema carpocapsae]